MNPVLVRLWLGRLVAILLIAKAVDNLVAARFVMFPYGPAPVRPAQDWIPLGLAGTIYSLLALLLWSRPSAVFPIPSTSTDASGPPTTTKDWLRLAGMILGIYLFATGLIGIVDFYLSNEYASGRSLGSVSFTISRTYSPARPIVNLVAGLVLFFVSGGYALAWPSRIWRMFSTAFLLQREDDEDGASPSTPPVA